MTKKPVPGALGKHHGDVAQLQKPPSPSGEAPQAHDGDAVLDNLYTTWHAFWDRYRETRLVGEAHYSLPSLLLNSLADKVPGLLSAPDLTFEQEFFEAASFGAFQGQALGDAAKPSAESQALDQATQTTVRNIQAMVDQERERIGIHPQDLKEAKARRLQAGVVATSQWHGYLGWLVSNAEFRGELTALRAVAAEAIRTRGRFPTRSQLASATAVHEVGENSLEVRLLEFYRRWSLERLLTWDWPQPMHPEYFGSLIHPPETSTEAGISLFLPWSVMQGGQIGDLQLISALKISAVPQHLRDWVFPPSNQKTEKAADFFELQAKLYRYYWLALRGRYEPRFHRRLQAIDTAFGEWLNLEPDTIRRHRLTLQKRLPSFEVPLEDIDEPRAKDLVE